MTNVHDYEQSAKQPQRTGVPPGAERPSRASLGNSAVTKVLSGLSRDGARSQGSGPLDEGIAADINAARGSGNELDGATRVDMEAHLGTDLSPVRVHTDTRADSLSRSVQARAFTTGNDVFFSSGSYSPGSTDGRRLLAHELTHVVQQSAGRGGQAGQISHPDDPHELEASAVGDAVASSPIVVQREAADEEMDTED